MSEGRRHRGIRKHLARQRLFVVGSQGRRHPRSQGRSEGLGVNRFVLFMHSTPHAPHATPQPSLMPPLLAKRGQGFFIYSYNLILSFCSGAKTGVICFQMRVNRNNCRYTPLLLVNVCMCPLASSLRASSRHCATGRANGSIMAVLL